MLRKKKGEAAKPASVLLPVATETPAEILTATPQRPWYKKKRYIIPIALLVFVVAVSAGGSNASKKGGDKNNGAQPKAISTFKPNAQPKATAAPKAKAPPTPQQALNAKIASALGPGNRKGIKRVKAVTFPASSGHIEVEWAVNDNITTGFIKDGARLDAVNILKAIKSSGVPYDSVFVNGSFPLQDKFGKSTEESVVRAAYTSATVNRIQFDNISFKTIFDLADSANIHPAFK
ncbi:MAG: hypothetical protein ACR2JO_04700 [Mycobacteriales bacterium]